jgi:hypothetical protein
MAHEEWRVEIQASSRYHTEGGLGGSPGDRGEVAIYRFGALTENRASMVTAR